MSTTSKIDPQDPRLTGYVLGALTPAALQRFERELAGCPASRAEVEALSATAALLGEALAAEPLTVLTAEQRAAVEAELSGQTAPAAPKSPDPPRAPQVQPPRRGWTREQAHHGPGVRIFSVVLAAAAVLLVVGGLIFVAVRGGEEQEREQRKQLVDERPRLLPITPEGTRVGGGPARRPAPRTAPRAAPSAPARRRVGSALPSRLQPEPEIKASGSRLSAAQIRAVLLTAKPAVKSCSNKYRGGGLLKVRITIQPTGKVEASILGSFAGTPMGYCILGAMYTLRFPSFSGAPITFVYPYRLMIGDTRTSTLPPPSPPPDGDVLKRAKWLLAQAQNAYVAGNHKRAVQLCKQVLKLIPNHYKAVQILGASSCYLRSARNAQWAYDRVAISYRPLLKKVCLNNGIELRSP